MTSRQGAFSDTSGGNTPGSGGSINRRTSMDPKHQTTAKKMASEQQNAVNDKVYKQCVLHCCIRQTRILETCYTQSSTAPAPAGGRWGQATCHLHKGPGPLTPLSSRIRCSLLCPLKLSLALARLAPTLVINGEL